MALDRPLVDRLRVDLAAASLRRLTDARTIDRLEAALDAEKQGRAASNRELNEAKETIRAYRDGGPKVAASHDCADKFPTLTLKAGSEVTIRLPAGTAPFLVVVEPSGDSNHWSAWATSRCAYARPGTFRQCLRDAGHPGDHDFSDTSSSDGATICPRPTGWEWTP